jgi:hypothetical protein
MYLLDMAYQGTPGGSDYNGPEEYFQASEQKKVSEQMTNMQDSNIRFKVWKKKSPKFSYYSLILD